MNCYDCHTTGTTATSVAICHCCGSGLCPDHLRVRRPVLHRTNGMGVSHSPTPARQLLCPTCHAAQLTGLPSTSPA